MVLMAVGQNDPGEPFLLAFDELEVGKDQLDARYAFFRVDGQDDSLALARRLVTDVGLGLAPGVAFGPEAEGWLRWCYASRDPQRLVDGVGRLARALRL